MMLFYVRCTFMVLLWHDQREACESQRGSNALLSTSTVTLKKVRITNSINSMHCIYIVKDNYDFWSPDPKNTLQVKIYIDFFFFTVIQKKNSHIVKHHYNYLSSCYIFWYILKCNSKIIFLTHSNMLIWNHYNMLIWNHSNMLIWNHSNMLIWNHSNMLIWNHSNMLIWNHSNMLIWNHSNMLIWNHSNMLIWNHSNMLIWSSAHIFYYHCWQQ